MKTDKYIEIFGSIDLLKNRVDLNKKYRRALAEILAYEKGEDLDTCDPIIASNIFNEVSEILGQNSLCRKMPSNSITNDGFIYFAEKYILSTLNVISLTDIKTNFNKLDKDTIKIIKNYLINIILVSEDTINIKYPDIVNYIWEVYKLENPNLHKYVWGVSKLENPKVEEDNINPPDALFTFINTITTATIRDATIRDASNLETLFLMKIKGISENDRKTMSKMYKYMPALFDHYFTGSNIFEK